MPNVVYRLTVYFSLPANLIFMLASSRRFSVLRSLCTMWWLWQYSTAERICQNFFRASLSLKCPLEVRWSAIQNRRGTGFRNTWRKFFIILQVLHSLFDSWQCQPWIFNQNIYILHRNDNNKAMVSKSKELLALAVRTYQTFLHSLQIQ